MNGKQGAPDCSVSTVSTTVSIGDDAYPRRLRAAQGAPPRLWVRGAYRPAERAVAVVGARAASQERCRLATAIGTALAGAGVDVISGGALGIDTAVHLGALAGRGTTVAVLGCGIDTIYPERNRSLFARLCAEGGALLSQFAPGTPVRRYQFPQRNRVIAGLCDLTVVVEAGIGSGSISTARAAYEFGRRVVAIPGSPGTDALVAGGATAAYTAEDVLRLLDGAQVCTLAPPHDREAARLYAALDEVARDVGELALRAQLPAAQCAAQLVDLELGGWAARQPGGRYFRLGSCEMKRE